MSATTSGTSVVDPRDSEQYWALLERVAASAHLRRATRLRELLLYVGRRAVKEGCVHLPEQEIGVRVFGRPEAYDNANDNIVRTNISELRKRIDAYFAGEGRDEALRMEIPRGSYIPVFRGRMNDLTDADLSLSISPAPLVAVEDQSKVVSNATDRRPWIARLLAALLGFALVALWLQERSASRALHPWQANPAVASFWAPFLANGHDTDLVLEDSSFLLIQDLQHQKVSLNDYLSGAYLQAGSSDPVTENLVRHLSRKVLGRATDFQLAQDIRALDPLNSRLHFYTARQYSPGVLKQDNVILLGNPTSNPWYQVFESRLNFTEEANTYGMSVVTNRRPQPGESATYGTTDTTLSYCAVAYLPKSDRTGNILLIQGTTSEATQAGGEFLLAEGELSDLLARWHVARPPYFELLLRVSHVQGAALTAQVEAYRTYPNLH